MQLYTSLITYQNLLTICILIYILLVILQNNQRPRLLVFIQVIPALIFFSSLIPIAKLLIDSLNSHPPYYKLSGK